MTRIAMPHIGLAGHLLPAARLGALLVEQGHEVMAWAPERYRAQVAQPGVVLRLHEPADTRRPFPTLVHFAAELAEATERCTEALVEQMEADRVELVVHDVHVPWARVAAEFLGLPRVVTDPLYPLSGEDAGPQAGPGGGVAPQTISLAPALASRVADPLARVARSRDAIGRRWGVELGDWFATVRSEASTALVFTTEEILGGPPPVGQVCVGPLLSPRVAPPTGDIGRPLVYVAFGTFFNGRPEPFRAVIDALREEPVDVLVSTGGGFEPSALGPRPANVDVRAYVDSRAILARAAVHVSHGGGGSVHESLVAGVPMVLLPQGSDQRAWAQRVEALGAGVIVDPDTADITAAVRQLLGDPRWGRRATGLGDSLLRHPGPSRVAEAIREATSARPRQSGPPVHEPQYQPVARQYPQ